MNDIYQYLIAAKTLVDGISNNKVANFAYTQTAYTEDMVDGVAEYSYGNDQNIPLGSHTDLEQNVRDKGIRSQAASLPRNAINHFFGRVSYNLNKITDTLNSFIAQITRAFTQNGSFYSALAEYKQYDTCTMLVTEDGGKLLKTFLRISSVPEVIQGVIPISDGVINTEHWKLMYSTDTVTQLTEDSSTKIASTELVDNKIEAYNSLVNAVLATKAPVNHASENTTYGVATTSEYGHIKLANALVNETTTVPTSAILFAVNNALTDAINSLDEISQNVVNFGKTTITEPYYTDQAAFDEASLKAGFYAARGNLVGGTEGDGGAFTMIGRNDTKQFGWNFASSLRFRGTDIPSASTWSEWYEIWHSGNDGPGSGSDADKLDGQHGSYYAPDSTVVKLSGNQSISGTKTFTSTIVGDISGNAATATKLRTARTITVSGDATGSVSFDGSANKTLTLDVTYATNADKLDGQHGSYYAPKASPSFTGTPKVNGVPVAGVDMTSASTVSGSSTRPLGTYVAVYDPSKKNRPRNSAYAVYQRESATRDYVFSEGDTHGEPLAGTWRCCGVTGFSENAYTYLMRRVA